MLKIKSEKKSSSNVINFVKRRPKDFAIFVAFSIFTLLAFRRQYVLLSYQEWGDESETIVTAKMMVAGIKLFSEIFNHHGPLTFLQGMILETFGSFGIRAHRVFIALLQIIGLVSIYKSPIIKNQLIKSFVVMLAATMILAYIPKVFGHMYLYQTLTGLFSLIIIVVYLLPATLVPAELTATRVFMGNLLIACLPFFAITFAPIACCYFLAGLRKEYLKVSFLGAFLGVVFNILFLGVFGSFAGFFAYHIYLNSQILPHYSGQKPGIELILNIFDFFKELLNSGTTRFLFVLLTCWSAFVIGKIEKGFPWRTLLLLLGIGSTLIRGGNWNGLPYFYALPALVMVLFMKVHKFTEKAKIAVLVTIILGAHEISFLIPRDRKEILSKTIPNETEFSRLVKDLTQKNDRIIAYSFKNFEYIASDRLPASGYFFYLPWQEEYNHSPKFGIKIDACQDIAKTRPKIMLIDKLLVWDQFQWESYGGCIQKILKKEYVQIFDRPYYVRRDLIDYEQWSKIAPSNGEIALSWVMSDANPIKLRFWFQSNGSKVVTRIGVLFRTSSRNLHGQAVLLLKKGDGSEYSQEIELSNLDNDGYKVFDLPPGKFISGEIKKINGDGIDGLEIYGDRLGTFTCLKYTLADGRWGFTPGCPLY